MKILKQFDTREAAEIYLNKLAKSEEIKMLKDFDFTTLEDFFQLAEPVGDVFGIVPTQEDMGVSDAEGGKKPRRQELKESEYHAKPNPNLEQKPIEEIHKPTISPASVMHSIDNLLEKSAELNQYQSIQTKPEEHIQPKEIQQPVKSSKKPNNDSQRPIKEDFNRPILNPIYQSIDTFLEKAGVKRTNKIPLTCSECGRGFELYPSEMHERQKRRKVNRWFCSKQCYGKWWGKQKGFGRGKYEESISDFKTLDTLPSSIGKHKATSNWVKEHSKEVAEYAQIHDKKATAKKFNVYPQVVDAALYLEGHKTPPSYLSRRKTSPKSIEKCENKAIKSSTNDNIPVSKGKKPDFKNRAVLDHLNKNFRPQKLIVKQLNDGKWGVFEDD